MKEVSCRAFGLFLDGLTSRGIPEERLVEGLPVSVDTLRGYRLWIDWDLFVQVCERLEELLGGPRGLFELGHDQFKGTSTFSFMRQVARVFRRPRDLYWMGTVWFGRTLFSILEDEFKDLPDKRIREVIRIPPQYRDCPQLFHLMHGALTAAPALLRYPDAEVEMSLSPHQAVYIITPPAREKFSLRGIKSYTSRFAAWDLIDSMSKQQEELKESLQGLATEREEVAEQLRLVQAIGHDLSTRMGLEDLTAAVSGAFEKHLPDWKVALWVQPADGDDARCLLEAADVSGPPDRSYPLRTGRGVVGRLEAWSGATDTDPRRAALLEALVPWLALALDGARSYAALRSAAIGPVG